MAVTFDIKYDRYTNLPKAETGVVGVTYGSGAPLCGEELNEIQELMSNQISHYQEIVAKLLGTTAVKSTSIIYSSYSFTTSLYNGYNKFTCGTSNNPGSIFITYSDDTLKGRIIKAKPSFIAPRNNKDYNVYCVISKNTDVTSKTPIWENGYIGTYFANSEERVPYDDATAISQDGYIDHPVDKYSSEKHEVSERCMISYKIILSETEIVASQYIKFGKISNNIFTPTESDSVFCLARAKYRGNTSFDVFVPTTSWSESGGVYKAEIKIDNSQDYRFNTPIVGLKLADKAGVAITNADIVSAYQSAFSCVDSAEVNDSNTLILKCFNDKPDIDFMVSVKAV